MTEAESTDKLFHIDSYKPKQRRKSSIYRKCEDLMEILWEDGYKNMIARHLLEDYVLKICGGFRTTVNDYLGKAPKYYRSRGREGCLKAPAKKGYLEKFGFIEDFNPRLVNLLHERVNRHYHWEETKLLDGVSFSHTLSARVNGEATAPIGATENDYTTTTKSEREIKPEKHIEAYLTPQEQAVFKARPAAEGPLPKIKWPKEQGVPQKISGNSLKKQG